MYRSAKTRPQYLLRQLITSSLTAGSLLLMPLIGTAETWDSHTELNDTIIMMPQTQYIVENGVTLTSAIPGGLGFIALWGFDYAGLNPNFINKGSINSTTVSEGNYGLFVIGGSGFYLDNQGNIDFPASGAIAVWGAPYATIDNSGTISVDYDNTIQLDSYPGVLNNTGTISAGRANAVLINYGSGTTVYNAGTIEVRGDYGAQNEGSIKVENATEASISNTNTGTISGKSSGIFITNSNNTLVDSAGVITAEDTTFAIYGGDGVTINNTGSIDSNGLVALYAADVNNLKLTNNNGGKINGNLEFLIGDTAPDIYQPTITLAGNSTLTGDIRINTYASPDVTWPTGITQAKDSPEVEAWMHELTVLKEQLSAALNDNTAVDKTVSSGKLANGGGADAAHTNSMSDTSEALNKKILEVQEKLAHAREDQINKVVDNYQSMEADQEFGGANLNLGTYSMTGTVSMSNGRINLLSGYQNNVNFSDDSLGNSFNVASGQNVGAVTLSQAAPTINIQGTVGSIILSDISSTNQFPWQSTDGNIQEFRANLSPSGDFNRVNFGPTKDNVYTTSTPQIFKIIAVDVDNLSTADVKANVSQPTYRLPMQIQVSSDNPANIITVDMGLGNPYCMSLVGSAGSVTIQDTHSQALTHVPGQMAAFGTDNCHTFVAANSGLLDSRYDKLSDKIINLDHKLQDGNTDWLFEVRYQDMRQDTDENQPHANSTILALSKLWHTTRGDWVFQASHDSTHIGQHLNNNSASIVLGHSQNWGKTSKLHMQLGGDRREMSLNLVGEQDTVIESSDYSVVYGEIGMGRVLHKFAGHDINMRMRLAAERIGSFGKGWDSDTISLMIPELSVSGRVLPSVLTDASHRLYGFLQKPMGDTTQKYTITGFSEDTFHYDTDVSGGIGYDLHAGVGANTMLHAKASYLNTGYLSLGLGISQNL